ncbi:MAG: PilT/PilU family type 4a pilus ATPase [Pseudomonadota bacterium]
MEIKPYLELMVKRGASDLFFSVGRPPTLKIHGTLYPVGEKPLTFGQTEGLIESLMPESRIVEFHQTHEANFAYAEEGIGRFRVSAFFQKDTPGVVLRYIVSDIPTVEELALPEQLNDIAMIKRGLVLLVGATGTGKSTTLAAMVGYRNKNSAGHILCIEDPIEYIHEHDQCIVNQREVGIDTESYEVALRNCLRQAPDVILIGEVRTREAMDQAIVFAETGHLCIATLHSNNANQALDRIINFFPEDRHSQLLLDLSLNLKAIIAQQLIPRADHKGLVPAVEILLNTPYASDLIRRGEVHEIKDLMKRSQEQGMVTFDQALVKLFLEEKISYENALRFADSANDVRLMIKLSGKGGAFGDGGFELNEEEMDEDMGPFAG